MNRRSLMRWAAAGSAALAGIGALGAEAAGRASLFFNVRDFGAQGNGTSLDTGALQAAIDACANQGGTVVFPAGVYLSGTLVLKSRVALWLQPGATILGSTDLKDYPSKIPKYRSYTDVNYVERSLIYAEGAEDIAIFGQGCINGQGEAKAFHFEKGRDHYKERPYLVRIIECQRVNVSGITLRNSPMWVQHYLACDDVVIDGITVHSLVNHNNDGIDIDGCSRMRISNCSITSGDDAIVLKSTGPRPCRSIMVTNCYLSSLCSAFKLGTESTGGFYDIAFSNSVIDNTRLAGIAIEEVDGGTLDGVTINNIRLRQTRGGIFVRLGNRARPYLSEGPGGGKGTHVLKPGMEIPGVGQLRHVCIAQVTGDGFDAMGCAIAGLPGHPIEDLAIEDVQLEFAGGGKAEEINLEVAEKETGYPEYKMFGRLPAFGFYCRHVRGLRLSDVHLSAAAAEARPGLVCDDVRDLEVRGWRTTTPPSAAPEIILRDTQDAWLHGNRAAGDRWFARVMGQGSRTIRFSHNWSAKPDQLAQIEHGVPADAVQVEK